MPELASFQWGGKPRAASAYEVAAEAVAMMTLATQPIVCWGEVDAQDHARPQARHQAAGSPHPRPPMAPRQLPQRRARMADRRRVRLV